MRNGGSPEEDTNTFVSRSQPFGSPVPPSSVVEAPPDPSFVPGPNGPVGGFVGGMGSVDSVFDVVAVGSLPNQSATRSWNQTSMLVQNPVSPLDGPSAACAPMAVERPKARTRATTLQSARLRNMVSLSSGSLRGQDPDHLPPLFFISVHHDAHNVTREYRISLSGIRNIALCEYDYSPPVPALRRPPRRSRSDR